MLGQGQTSRPSESLGYANSQQGMVPTPYQPQIGQSYSNFGQPNPLVPNIPQNSSLNTYQQRLAQTPQPRPQGLGGQNQYQGPTGPVRPYGM
jgi:hypothetical protein